MSEKARPGLILQWRQRKQQESGRTSEFQTKKFEEIKRCRACQKNIKKQIKTLQHNKTTFHIKKPGKLGKNMTDLEFNPTNLSKKLSINFVKREVTDPNGKIKKTELEKSLESEIKAHKL